MTARRRQARRALACALISVCCCLAAGCGKKWPVTAQYAENVVRSELSARYGIVKLRVRGVTQRSRLVTGRPVYEVTAYCSGQFGDFKQVFAVDAETGRSYTADETTLDSNPMREIGK
jgi:hypothetical protein